MTTIVGPPTYPAPIQQIFFIFISLFINIFGILKDLLLISIKLSDLLRTKEREFIALDLSEKELVAGAIPKGDKYDKMITNLRRLVFDQTRAAINLVLQDLPALQKRAIGETLTLRIPMIYQMIQIEKYANLKGLRF